MLENLTTKLARLSSTPEPPDPTRFDDPLAQRTSWKPCKRGGTNFRTRKLVPVGANRVELRISGGAVLLYLFFFAMGIGVPLQTIMASLKRGAEFATPDLLLPVGVGLLFTSVGGTMLYKGLQPIVFDRTNGWFWKGRTDPGYVRDLDSKRKATRLSDIHALQILSEYVRGNKSSYYSYELNLVLEDAGRVNVVDHGNLDALRGDAETLGRFLGVPVWDGTPKD